MNYLCIVLPMPGRLYGMGRPAGILILVIPRLLNYIVVVYLIVIGILGLGHH